MNMPSNLINFLTLSKKVEEKRRILQTIRLKEEVGFFRLIFRLFVALNIILIPIDLEIAKAVFTFVFPVLLAIYFSLKFVLSRNKDYLKHAIGKCQFEVKDELNSLEQIYNDLLSTKSSEELENYYKYLRTVNKREYDKFLSELCKMPNFKYNRKENTTFEVLSIMR